MKDDMESIMQKPVKHVKGVGDSRAVLFHRLNIYTIGDLLYHFPREYEDRSSLKKIVMLQDGESCAFEGEIVSPVTEHRIRRGLSIYKVFIRDETGTILGTWYNQRYVKNVFKAGERYIFYGRISKKYRSFEVENPVYEKAGNGIHKNTCRIVPVYPSTANLSQNIIRSVISSALEMVAGKIPDVLPPSVRDKYHLSEINYSMRNIHFPESEEALKNSRARLVFEELLILQLSLLEIKNSLEDGRKGIEFKPASRMQDFISNLPFKLTGAQRRAFSDIEKDMESRRVMNRLIQGDVGSGKTIVAAMALFKAAENGYQGALMVPTEILAEQHYKSLNSLLKPYGIKVELLTGSLTKKQKTEVLDRIKTGETDIVIGTHALIEDTVEFMRLGLVITDEQHRFGVRQRTVLSKKGYNPDVLVMTATPIPRTLALILYGDLDISLIDELPPGRKPVETYAVNEGMRERINNFIRKKVSEGRQVYIVCPLVEESDTIEGKSAVELANRIARRDFSELKVGLIHGKMKSAEKERTMRSFVDGEINILVSTTVIEVGVNVPNATVMVVENAERFGLAQLHQLRGRVGRGEHQSYCILYNNSKSQVTDERMKIMQKTNDGFVVSEKDLELRGPGEFFGTRQHGIPELKIANLYKDMDILKLAQEAAANILAEDRHLASEENRGLKEKVLGKNLLPL